RLSLCFYFLLSYYHTHLYPHSFPTRRSSDLSRSSSRANQNMTFDRTTMGVNLITLNTRNKSAALVGRSSHFRISICDLRFAARKDRKSTRLNSSHQIISYAVFCLKKKNKTQH